VSNVARRRAEALPLPAEREPVAVARWLPSGRSLLIGFVIAALAGGAYLIARETSLFALRTVRVEGASSDVAERIREVLKPLVGSSLVAFDRAAAERRLEEIPAVSSVTFDRAFPHTLRVGVRLETAVAVLRQGPSAWLVSRGGRVLEALTARPYPALPRIWLPAGVNVTVGAGLSAPTAWSAQAAGALAGGALAHRVASVRSDQGEITLVLRTGVEVRLGDLRNLPLKLTIADRILRLAPGSAYVDVSLPERSVAAYNSQVQG
jgi:cell division protein FtsQ